MPADIIQIAIDKMGQWVWIYLNDSSGNYRLRVNITGLSHIDGVPHVTTTTYAGHTRIFPLDHIVHIEN